VGLEDGADLWRDGAGKQCLHWSWINGTVEVEVDRWRPLVLRLYGLYKDSCTARARGMPAVMCDLRLGS
jgi:hypothetical protein